MVRIVTNGVMRTPLQPARWFVVAVFLVFFFLERRGGGGELYWMRNGVVLSLLENLESSGNKIMTREPIVRP